MLDPRQPSFAPQMSCSPFISNRGIASPKGAAAMLRERPSANLWRRVPIFPPSPRAWQPAAPALLIVWTAHALSDFAGFARPLTECRCDVDRHVVRSRVLGVIRQRDATPLLESHSDIDLCQGRAQVERYVMIVGCAASQIGRYLDMSWSSPCGRATMQTNAIARHLGHR